MSEPDSNLTPAQDDAVRALLASARHTAPTPSDVVARLEATLGSLSEERREVRPETRAPVITLASRRRRTAATLVLAAAAVVVAGVGIGQVLPSGMSGQDAGSSAESAGSAAESSTLAEDGLGPEADSQADAGADSKLGATEMRSQDEAAAPTPRALADLSALSSDAELRPQVRALRPAVPFTASFDDGAECLVEAQRGESVGITYDGQPGVLVYRVPARDRQRVDVYVCGEPDALRSLQLRAP